MDYSEILLIEEAVENALYNLEHSRQATEGSKRQWMREVKYGVAWLKDHAPDSDILNYLNVKD